MSRLSLEIKRCDIDDVRPDQHIFAVSNGLNVASVTIADIAIMSRKRYKELLEKEIRLREVDR